jgi:chitin synthase
MDVHFVIKHKNRSKIESHLWFFKGFCNQLNPTFSFIIDAGTIALWNSISRMILYMEVDPQVGGCAGEIEVMLPDKNEDGSPITFFESIIIRSQYLEYKISHYLDKAAESFFGYVSVLPGAFSAFRWKAIQGKPLKKFLKGQTVTDSKLNEHPSCFKANMYLAEDRIMCLEIVAEIGENYILSFMPGCKALTDAPSTITQLIRQRRRWFNGSLFASIHVLLHM